MRCSSFALMACLAAGCAAVPKAAEHAESQPAPPVSPAREAGAPAVAAQADPSAETAADLAARRALEEKVLDEVDFKSDSLESVLDRIRDAAGVNMAVQWGAIEQVGVRRDRAVALKLKRVSAAQALKVVLAQVSTELEPEARLVAEPEGGIFTVTTRKELADHTVRKSYDVRDLLIEVPIFNDAPTLGLMPPAAGGGGGGANIFTTEAAPEAHACDGKMMEELIARIKRRVGTKAEWDENQSEIEACSGDLDVKTTPDHHRALALLLAEWRARKGLSIAWQARVLRMPAAEVEKWAGQSHGTLALDAAQVAALVERAGDSASGIQELAAARQCARSGQRTYVVGRAQKGFAADVSPVFPPGGKITDDKTTTTDGKEGSKTVRETRTTEVPPELKGNAPLHTAVDVLNEGLVFDLDAVASGDHKQVQCTLRAAWSDKASLRPIKASGNEQVDLPQQENCQWRTTTTIPSGGAVLLSASTPAKAGENTMETVLLLQATVVEAKGK